jgi:hypothetical protein
MRTRRMVAATLVVATLGVATFTWAAGRGGGGVDPSSFAHPKANPYFPLVPGTVSIYRGSEDRVKLHERLTVTHRTKRIVGVQTVVIRDVLRTHGRLVEATTDWYQADDQGNVWYFGEDTATYKPDGTIESREGTWLAGRNGATAGIIMPANPVPTDAYRQEFYPGHAEDQAWIVQRGLHVTIPLRTVDHVVRSYEWTRLEPGVISMKLYGPHLGIIRERDIAGGNESLDLVKILRP